MNIILNFLPRKIVSKMLGNILNFGGENNVLFEHFFHPFGCHELHTFYWLFSQFFGTRNIDMHVVFVLTAFTGTGRTTRTLLHTVRTQREYSTTTALCVVPPYTDTV